jgi:5-hydroxyisourate hydrolase-like protein (transthyretin family)
MSRFKYLILTLFLVVSASLASTAASAIKPLDTNPNSMMPSVARDLFEVDNIMALAKSIPSDGTAQQRSLYPFGDEDWVVFQAVEGRSYRLETAPYAGSNVDTYLELYGADGTLLAYADDGGFFVFSRLYWTASASANFYLRVRGFKVSDTGEYLLSVNDESPAHITGTVIADEDGRPVPGVWVGIARLYGDFWSGSGSAGTDAAGNYDVGGLTAGVYRVFFGPPKGTYLSELYDNVFYGDLPDVEAATRITLTTGAILSGINASLATGGQITGVVTGPDGLTPLPNIKADVKRAWGYSTGDVAVVTTDTSGRYQVGGLQTGNYRICFSDPEGDYFRECYDNLAVIHSYATDIPVALGLTTPNINASLALAGRIKGTVTRPDGKTPARVLIEARGNGEYYYDTSDSNGRYTIGELPTGVYRVGFDSQRGNTQYLTEYYDNAHDWADATPITVTTGEAVTGIDASLTLAGYVSGTVISVEGAPLYGIWAIFRSAQGSLGGLVSTNPAGVYEAWIDPGTYSVQFHDEYSGYFDVYRDGVISIGSGTVITGINAVLPAGGRITGRITGPDGEIPVMYGAVTLERRNPAGWEQEPQIGNSDVMGYYTVVGLTTGVYRLYFMDQSGLYLPEFYDDAPTADLARDVAVTVGVTTSGVNASLDTHYHLRRRFLPLVMAD